MAIVIEEPTAEAIFAALREVSVEEKQKLRALLDERQETAEEEREETLEEEEEAWRQISAVQAVRFFEEEEAA